MSDLRCFFFTARLEKLLITFYNFQQAKEKHVLQHYLQYYLHFQRLGELNNLIEIQLYLFLPSMFLQKLMNISEVLSQ